MTNALVYTASTISFTAATSTIADSASGLGNFIVNTKIVISGSASNNGTFTVVFPTPDASNGLLRIN